MRLFCLRYVAPSLAQLFHVPMTQHPQVMTAKEQNLWKPMGDIDAEDIQHMQSRLEIFPCRARLGNLKETAQCPNCMSKWIYEATVAYDGRQMVQPPLSASLATDGARPNLTVVAGFRLSFAVELRACILSIEGRERPRHVVNPRLLLVLRASTACASSRVYQTPCGSSCMETCSCLAQ